MSIKKTIAAGTLGLATLLGASGCASNKVPFSTPTVTLEEQVARDSLAKELAAIPGYWEKSDAVGYGMFDHKNGLDYFFREFWDCKKDGKALKFIQTVSGEPADFKVQNNSQEVSVSFRTISSYIIFAKDGIAVKILPYDNDYVARINELRLDEYRNSAAVKK
jgi:hypothetical protein